MQELDYSDTHGKSLPYDSVPRSYENLVLSLESRVEKLEEVIKRLRGHVNACPDCRKIIVKCNACEAAAHPCHECGEPSAQFIRIDKYTGTWRCGNPACLASVRG